MNILHVIQRYYPYIGGAEQVFQEIGERLARDSSTVTVYTTNAWDLESFWRQDRRVVDLESELRRGVFIQRFPVAYLPFSPLAFPALKRGMALLAELPFDATPLLFRLAQYAPYVPALDRALATTPEPFELVHTANISLDSSAVAAYRFARAKRIPFVITPFLHLGEADDARVRRFYTLPHQMEMLRRADAVIVMTPREGAALLEGGVLRERIHQIGAGVDPAALAGGNAEQFRSRHNLSGPIVAYIGTAAYDKGTVHLLEAMEQLWQTRDATLVLAGSQLSAFETFWSKMPASVRERTRLLGFISESEKLDLLAACDVLAMPSRTDSFGIVFLEAWLYDKPVIGAEAGGVPDVITHEKDGYLVKFGDTTTLTARLRELIDDPLLARRMGSAGHMKVLHSMTWEEQYGKVRDLYERLIRAHD